MFWNLPYLFIYKKYTILNHFYNENLFYFTLDATGRGLVWPLFSVQYFWCEFASGLISHSPFRLVPDQITLTF
jgi:hypothetical protein